MHLPLILNRLQALMNNADNAPQELNNEDAGYAIVRSAKFPARVDRVSKL